MTMLPVDHVKSFLDGRGPTAIESIARDLAVQCVGIDSLEQAMEVARHGLDILIRHKIVTTEWVDCENPSGIPGYGRELVYETVSPQEGILWTEFVKSPFMSPTCSYWVIPVTEKPDPMCIGEIKAWQEVNRRFDKGEPHHCTLQYGVEYDDIKDHLDIEFEAIAAAHRCDDRAQSLVLELPPHIRPLWKGETTPHVTVSYKEFPVHGGAAAVHGEDDLSFTPFPIRLKTTFHRFQRS
jgi:hypothetical protein